MRKMQVLSISLKDYTVREAMRKVNDFLKDGKVSTIVYITKKGIMEADEDERIKQFVESVDLTISADADVLRAANVETRNRIREIENNEFLYEFLRKMSRQKESIYLLAETVSELDALEKVLSNHQVSLNIIGRFALEELQNDEEFLVNEMNKLEPNVIISSLTSMRRIDFYEANHMKLNANIWMMLKDDMSLYNKKMGFFRKISNDLTRKVFQKRIDQYRG